jgi:transposase
MHDVQLFSRALGLDEPWEVVGVQFDGDQRWLDLRVDVLKGSRFACRQCAAAGCKVHDSEQKTWRHLDFFEHRAYLTARVPRVVCREHGTLAVQVPWARERSGFSLLFEALVMALVRQMPVAIVAALIGESDMRVWRILHHYVDEAVEQQDLAGLRRLGIDETSSRRGQNYVTVFADLDERRAVDVTEDRDAGTVQELACFVDTHGGDVGAVQDVSQDISGAYVAGVREHLPTAKITFDRYHICQ